MKTCNKCKQLKEYECFNKCSKTKDNFNDTCKQCRSIIRIKRKSKIQEYQKRYYQEHKELKNKKTKEYYIKNREKIRIRDKVYRDKHPERINKIKIYQKNRMKYDKLYKLRKNISSLIGSVLRSNSFLKKSNTAKLLGCTYEVFLNHVGLKPDGDYHLDYICPCAQAQNEEELIKLQHYTNFRWLKAEDNLSKSNCYTIEAEEMCRMLLNRKWRY